MQEDCRESDGTRQPAARHQARRQPPQAPARTCAPAAPRWRAAAGCGRRRSASPPRSAAPRSPVYRRLRVALFSTGDEVREPGAALPPGAIYDANRYALPALLQGARLRGERSRHPARPAPTTVARRARRGGRGPRPRSSPRAACRSARRITSRRRSRRWASSISGASPSARAGRSRWARSAGVPFIGLPGNPVAVMVTFLLLARPLILRLSGASAIAPRLYRVRRRLRLSTRRRSRAEYLRARLERGGDGGWVARQIPARRRRHPVLDGRGRRAGRARRRRDARSRPAWRSISCPSARCWTERSAPASCVSYASYVYYVHAVRRFPPRPLRDFRPGPRSRKKNAGTKRTPPSP